MKTTQRSERDASVKHPTHACLHREEVGACQQPAPTNAVDRLDRLDRLAYLHLFPQRGGCVEDAGVDEAGDGEDAPDDATHLREEGRKALPLLPHQHLR